jgi:hypothetical protein
MTAAECRDRERIAQSDCAERTFALGRKVPRLSVAMAVDAEQELAGSGKSDRRVRSLSFPVRTTEQLHQGMDEPANPSRQT